LPFLLFFFRGGWSGAGRRIWASAALRSSSIAASGCLGDRRCRALTACSSSRQPDGGVRWGWWACMCGGGGGRKIQGGGEVEEKHFCTKPSPHRTILKEPTSWS
jgi:hypothetical protein